MGKHYLYMAMGMVNICTVKAREFKPSSFPLPVSFCSLCLSTQENRTIKTEKKKRIKAFLSSACVCCCPLAIAVSQLAFCFSWQERRTVQQVLLEDILAAGCLVNMHVCFLTIPSFHSINFLSIKTDELSVKPHCRITVTAAPL